jgi:hypothetical protein
MEECSIIVCRLVTPAWCEHREIIWVVDEDRKKRLNVCGAGGMGIECSYHKTLGVNKVEGVDDIY